MLLLVGLGNPGDKYARHRHNVGFMAVDAIADAHGFGPARSKFQGALREGKIGGEKALILKPQTYMNDSGRSVSEAARFYKIALEDVIVFYEKLSELPEVIDRYFDNTMVNAEDEKLRVNRQTQMKKLAHVIHAFADFNQLVF